MNERFNLILALVLSVSIIVGWQHFYERPRLAKAAAAQKQYKKQVEMIASGRALVNLPAVTLKRDEAIKTANRVKINSDKVHGSINLQGLRFDDLTLADYYETLEKKEEVALFSPSNTDRPYFTEIGWVSSDANLELPNSSTVWQADNGELSPGHEVIFTWVNGQGVVFRVTVGLDQHYMFSLKQTIENFSDKPLVVQPYGLINRYYSELGRSVVHEGFIGDINGDLAEYTYSNIKDKKLQQIKNARARWLGISDKYWLTSLIPDQEFKYTTNVAYAKTGEAEKVQLDYVAAQQIVPAGSSVSVTSHLFAGAKNVNLLDQYEKQFDIELFDRAIDFGWFYVITKPLFYAMSYVYSYVGNFGVSILVITILIKLVLFGFTSKSYTSMRKLRKLQPQMARLKELYGNDAAKMHQETMALYKREKVNPLSGCLPILIQIPIFFSLYKVLNVTLEMRHAPFYGWIKDLSAMDTSNIFNLFGLLPFDPPSLLHLGILPILVSGTMYLQQKMSPPPTDPMQAKMMQFLPLIFLFTFRSFPAGLLLYWTFSNILSIFQQYFVNANDNE